MQGICKLCDNEAELRQSHIIPNFVYRWQLKTSGTDFIRCGEAPNKRVQDGHKPYYFCDECEGKFSKWETVFSNKIFRPLNNGIIVPCQYLDWLLKFAVSVSWRVLLHKVVQRNISYLPEKLENEAYIALEVWKEFLNDKRPHPDKYQQHIIILSETIGYTGDIPANINRYTLRCIEMEVSYNDSGAFVYTKIGKILLIGFIDYHKLRHYWNGSQIHVKKGVLESNMSVLPPEIREYYLRGAENAQAIEASISPKQREKIDETYKKNKKIALDSETVKATQLDIELFGKDKVFKRK